MQPEYFFLSRSRMRTREILQGVEIFGACECAGMEPIVADSWLQIQGRKFSQMHSGPTRQMARHGGMLHVEVLEE